MSVIPATLKTETMLFQTPGFHSTLYDIPSKLMIFYNAFAELTAQLLNDDKKNKDTGYKAILDINIYQVIKVYHLFDMYSDHELVNSGVLRIGVPVVSMFDSKKLLQELVHEVAHYAGDKFRKRKKRYESIIKILKNLFLMKIDNKIENCWKIILNDECKKNDFQTFIKEYLGECFKKELDNFIENDINTSKNKFSYEEKYTNDILSNTLSKLFGYEELRKFLYLIATKLRIIDSPSGIPQSDRAKKISEIINSIGSNLSAWDYSSQIYIIHQVMKESFADLMMLILLNINNPIQYIKRSYNIIKDYHVYTDAEPLCGDDVLVRIDSVIRVFAHKSLEEVIDDIKNNIDEIDTEVGENERASFVNFLDSMKKLIMNKKTFHEVVVNETVEYLKECKAGFEKHLCDVNKKHEDLKKFYSIVDTQSIEEFVHIFRKMYSEFFIRNN